MIAPAQIMPLQWQRNRRAK